MIGSNKSDVFLITICNVNNCDNWLQKNCAFSINLSFNQVLSDSNVDSYQSNK